jgi:A/G-specific adenine glycosylase
MRRALLDWFALAARDLPWRTRRNPWRVWVAEVMLQQTRVEAVIEPYARFLAAFPSLAALARAQESEVLARWSGLGYYRRARLLHAGARFVVAHHRGKVPRTRAELEAVPGIGAYTAGALLSIAFGEREIAIDANVTRVVARLLALEDWRSAAGREQIVAFAAALVDDERPGDVNEALMDLGSAVCTAKAARCGECPLARLCRARAFDDPVAFGAPRVRKPPRRVQLACAVVRDGGKVLFLQRAREEALLGGMWELPTLEFDGDVDAAKALVQLIRRRSGLATRLTGPLATVQHAIVGRKISAEVYAATVRVTAGRAFPAGARMLAPDEHAGVALPALPVRILRVMRELATKRSS